MKPICCVLALAVLTVAACGGSTTPPISDLPLVNEPPRPVCSKEVLNGRDDDCDGVQDWGNHAVFLDGQADFVQMPNASEWELSSDALTVEAWVNWWGPEAESSRIFSKGSDQWSRGYMIALVPDRVMAEISPGNGWGARCSANSRITRGYWHHIGVVFDTVNETITIYMDGYQDKTCPAKGIANKLFVNNVKPTIGIADNLRHSAMNGYIDEVRVWDHARSAVQIQSALATRLNGTESGLLGYWSFEPKAPPQRESAQLLGGNAQVQPIRTPRKYSGRLPR